MASIGGTKATLPARAGAGSALVVRSEAQGIVAAIDLPGAKTGVGQVAEDGTVVYPASDASGDSTAVQLLANGSTRVQTVIGGRGSDHQIHYRMRGFRPIMSGTSAAFLQTGDGEGMVPLEEPWAVDARGRAVPTHYEIRGDSLVQVVEAGSRAAYPIVADPVWVWMNFGFGAKLNRYETNRAKDYAGAAAICAALAGQLRRYVTVSCGVYAAWMTTQSNLANSDRPKSCLYLVVIPAPTVWRYRDGYCK